MRAQPAARGDQRVTDAERRAAAAVVRYGLATGQVSSGEADERMREAFSAVTVRDLRVVTDALRGPARRRDRLPEVNAGVAGWLTAGAMQVLAGWAPALTYAGHAAYIGTGWGIGSVFMTLAGVTSALMGSLASSGR